jgi:hypothetical protein
MVNTIVKIELLSIASILLIPFLSSNSFGEEPLSDYSFWQLVYVGKDSCLSLDEQRVNQYYGFVSKYFELYQFDNYGFKPKCLSFEDYSSYNKPYSADLTILVFDNYLGNKLLHKNAVESLYGHFGTDKTNSHVIMIAEPPKFYSLLDSASIGWDASHQLSHFILSFKGYNHETIERLLHSNPLSMRDCIGTRISDSKCDEVRTYMRINNDVREFVVMTPLQELIGDGLTKYVSKDVISFPVVRDLHRDITKWWLDGIIDDESYLAATKHIINVPITADIPIDNKIIEMPNGFLMIDEYQDDIVDWQGGHFNAFGTDSNVHEVLFYIPFDVKSAAYQENQKEIPSWFKQRAEGWSEQKLGDKIFYDGLDALIRNGILGN